MQKLKYILSLIVLLATTVWVAAQETYVIDSVCVGATRDYRIDGEKGSTYDWFILDTLGNTEANPAYTDFTFVNSPGDTIWGSEISYTWIDIGYFDILTLHYSEHGCDTIEQGRVMIYELPFVDAGDDQIICASDSVFITSDTAYNYRAILWTTLGDGVFVEDTILHPTYIAGANDIASGGVQLILTGSGLAVNTTCAPAVDTVTIQLSDPAVVIDVVNNLCYNERHGSLKATASGGFEPYTFQWSAPWGYTATGDEIFDLQQGLYTLVVTDAIGCTIQRTAVVKDPPELISSIDSFENVNCFGGNDGIARVLASGGVGNYTYEWNTTPVQTTALASGLSYGEYIVTVKDSNNCVSQDTVFIGEPTEFVSNIDSVEHVLCFEGNNGYARVILNGGTLPYNYSWTGPSGFVSTDSVLTNLFAGIYYLSASDGNGCLVLDTVEILEPTQLLSNIDSIENVSCFGGNDGMARVVISGGVGNYTYSWNTVPEQTTAIASNLIAGEYIVTVSDSNTCIITDTVIISEPLDLVLTETHIDVKCKGAKPGSIDLTVSGGTPFSIAPYYLYEWSDTIGVVSTIEDLNGLVEAMLYTVVVTDSLGCSDTLQVYIDEEKNMQLTAVVDSILCFADSSGMIDLSIKHGKKPFEYAWSNSVEVIDTVNEDLINIPAGFYRVVVNDANGCGESMEFTLTEPEELIVTIDSVRDISCFGFDNGYVQLLVTGGTYPYNYSWTGPSGYTASDSTIANLAPGMYHITVTDANNCLVNDSMEILEPAELLAGIDSINNVSCFAAADGYAQIIVSGGTFPYSFDWTGPVGFNSTDSTINNLSGGMYYVTVTDNNSCQIEDSVFIKEPIEMFATIDSIGQVSCFASNDGFASVSVIGGTRPYTYSWTGPDGFTSTDSAIVNLLAGMYYVSVTDSNYCQAIDSIEITEPAELIAIIDSIKNVTCFANSDGYAQAIVSGGTLPYTFAWTGPNSFTSSDSVIVDLIAGTYYLSVEDNNNCMAFDTIEITEPDELIAIIDSISHVTCFGFDNGYAQVAVSGGTQPYIYDWTGPSGFTSSNAMIEDLFAGMYYVTVTDSNKCIATDSVEIVQPDELIAIIDSVEHVACFGNNDGYAQVVVSGGTLPYSFDWTGPAGFTSTDSVITNIGSGMFYVTVTDSNNCITLDSVEIQESSQLVALIDSSANVICYGENNGYTQLVVSGGTLPYSFDWTGPAGFTSTDSILTGLLAGKYFVSVSDSNKCMVLDSVEITQPSELLATIDSIEHIACYNGNNGYARAIASGGTFPYNFAWTGPNSFTSTDSIVTDLIAGMYYLSVTDDNGCFVNDSIEIVQPEELLATIDSIEHVTCFGNNDGFARVTVTGGTRPYNYNWTGPAGFTSTDSLITSLFAGMYYLSISDTNKCIVQDSVEILEPLELLSFVDNVSHVSCFGLNDGYAEVSVSGGTAPYTFAWNGPAGFTSNDSIISGLFVGKYYLTVTDTNNCIVLDTVEITEPDELIAIIDSVENVSCFAESDGYTQVAVNGGTYPYVYNWTGPAGFTSTDSVLSNIVAGMYYVIVTDDNNCSSNDSIEVTQPDELIALVDSVVNVTCFGASDGYANVIVTGGTQPYNYEWTGPNGYSGFTSEIADVVAGMYYITVTDSNNCVALDSIEILESTQLIATIDSIKNVTCFGNSDGYAQVAVVGGTSPYYYSWTGPDGFTSSDSVIQNIIAGKYIVAVTDSNNCLAIDSVEINEASELLASIDSSSNVSCFGGNNGYAQVVVSGGTLPYSFSWTGPSAFVSTDSLITNLIAGMYYVTISDINNCLVLDSVEITEPPQLLASIDSVNHVTCFNYSDGLAKVTVSGGTKPYQYSWTGPAAFASSDSIISALFAGIYYITINDSNFCEVKDTIEILQPEELLTNISIDTTDICESDSIQLISGTSGGTGLYSYSWSGNGAVYLNALDNDSVRFGNAPAGIYNLVLEVNDENFCVAFDSTEIIVLPRTYASVDTTICISDLPFVYNGNTYPGAGTYLDTLVNVNGCDSVLTLNLDIDLQVIPEFDSIVPIYQYAIPPLLSLVSNNGIPGTWSPDTISTEFDGIYEFIFTPDSGWCATNDTMFVEILPMELILTCPPADTVECFANVPPAFNSLNEFILAGGDLISTCEIDTSSFALINTDISTESCPTTITRRYEISTTFLCDSSVYCEHLIIVHDTTPPVLTCPDTILVGLKEPIPMAFDSVSNFVAAGGFVDDNCGIVESSWAVINEIMYPGALYDTIMRTYYIEDTCGLSASCEHWLIKDKDFQITVNCPDTLWVECWTDVPSPLLSFQDFQNIGGDASSRCGIADSTFTMAQQITENKCPEYLKRTYEVYDSCSNLISCERVIVIYDETPPTIDCLEDLIVTESTVPDPYLTLLEFTTAGGFADDNCGIENFVFTETETGDNPRILTRTYAVIDTCGNRDECQQVINVYKDGDLACPPQLTVECINQLPPYFTNVNDFINAGGEAENFISFFWVDDTSNGEICPEIVTRRYAIEDNAGDTIYCSQFIYVFDITNPIASNILPDLEFEITRPNPAYGNDEIVELINDAGITDNCEMDEEFLNRSRKTISLNNCERVFEYTYELHDLCGNPVFVTQIITQKEDNDIIVFREPESRVECEIPEVYDYQAWRDAGGSLLTNKDVVFTHLPEYDTYVGDNCNGELERTYLLTSECADNFWVETVIIEDVDAPVFVAVPANKNGECTEFLPYTNYAEFVADGGWATDNCILDTASFKWVKDEIISDICPRVIYRTYEINDSCLNGPTSYVDTITIFDNTPPFAQLLPDLGPFDCYAEIPAANINDVTAWDECDSTVTVQYLGDTEDPGCEGTVIRTYRLSDICGNDTSITQNIFIDYSINPEVLQIPEIPEGCTIPGFYANYKEFYDAGGRIADRLCHQNDSLILLDFIGDVADGGTCPKLYTRTYKITDECGNETFFEQYFNIDDRIAPQFISCAPDIDSIGYKEIPLAYTLDEFLIAGGDTTDNCGIQFYDAYTLDSTRVKNVIDIERMYVITDFCGNTDTCYHHITAYVVEPIVMSCPPTISGFDCYADLPDTLTIDEFVDRGGWFTSYFGIDSATFRYVSEYNSPENIVCSGTVTRIYEVTDSAGQVVTCEHNIEIFDPITPEINSPDTIYVQNINDIPAPYSSQQQFESAGGYVWDNCHLFDFKLEGTPVWNFGLQADTLVRTYSVRDGCFRTVEDEQLIIVIDTTLPQLVCPDPADFNDIKLNDLASLTGLPYSETWTAINLDDTTKIGISTRSKCPIQEITYFDDSLGNCPIVITRTFRVLDICGDDAFCSQTITILNAIRPVHFAIGPLCQNSVPPPLPLIDANGVSGTWSPATIDTDNPGIFDYIFTPDIRNGCSVIYTMQIEIIPATVPEFNLVDEFCLNAVAPALPTTDDNGVTGIWSPNVISTDALGAYTYTFTPDAGFVCPEIYTLVVNIRDEILPRFTQIDSLCVNSVPPVLPTVSLNGVSGTWNPTTIRTSVVETRTYTFTPDPGGCELPTTMVITIYNATTPEFDPIGPLCLNSTPPQLQGISNNGILGSWNPSTIFTGAIGALGYTFTPAPGQCAVPVTISIEIDDDITPLFAQLGPFCQFDLAPDLPLTSDNGINGTWSPSAIETSIAGTFTYTFTPNPGECGGPVSMNIEVLPQTVPRFFQIGPLCINSTPPNFPTTDLLGIRGSFSLATIRTDSIGVFEYIFYANDPRYACLINDTMYIEIIDKTQPELAPIGPLCLNSVPPSLPAVSVDGYAGNWSPSTISTAALGSFDYIFTPDDDCTIPDTLTIEIVNDLIPVFAQMGPFCLNSTPPALPTVSENGITGSWNPSTIQTSALGSTIYTFTPDPGQCATGTNMTIDIVDEIIPIFAIDLTLCINSTPPVLPTVSENGITGSWSPDSIDASVTGIKPYLFTPDPGQCANPFTLNMDVMEKILTSFAPIAPICFGSQAPDLPSISIEGITGTWSPAFIDSSLVGVVSYTFTPDAGWCATGFTMDIEVNPAVVISETHVNVGFSNDPIGSIDLTVEQGTAPFNFVWDSGQTTEDISGLAKGSYFVTVTDINDCRDTLTVVIEGDDANPWITCPATEIVNCYSDIAAFPIYNTFAEFKADNGEAGSSCGINESTFTFVDEEIITGPYCYNIKRTYSIADSCGNVVSCDRFLAVNDTIPPVILCFNSSAECLSDLPDDITTVSEFINAGGVIYDNCDIDFTSFTITDKVSMEMDNLTEIRTTYSVKDLCGNESTCTSVFTLTDTIPPLVSCTDITVFLDEFGKYDLTNNDIIRMAHGMSDNCTSEENLIVEVDFFEFDCTDVENTIGANVVVTDEAGNQTVCIANVTVKDSIAPQAICQDITVYLDANGQAQVDLDQINNGSFDNCAIDTIYLSQNEFDCSHVGDNPVTLTIIDKASNLDTCMANIIVIDSIPPVVNCVAPFELQLDQNAEYTLTIPELITGSSDECGVDTIFLSKYDLNCDDIGITPITVTAFDVNGNVDSCTVEITVYGNIAPNVLNDTAITAQNIPVAIDVVLNDYDTKTSINLASLSVAVSAQNGTVEKDPVSGLMIYTPDFDFAGIDSFYYSICDDGIPCIPMCGTALVYIKVLEENEPPVAVNDSFIVMCGILEGEILSNDYDPNAIDDIFLETTPVHLPIHGYVTVEQNGKFVYTPDEGFTGVDSFVYRICDNGLPSMCDTAVVYIDKLPDNDCDGVPDWDDIDDDNDGILDIVESPNGVDIDSDLDGIVDRLDIDADNDGIVDNVEGQSEDDYIPPTGLDTNGNGWDDAYDPADGGYEFIPIDTDNDMMPDYIDIDSENDNVFDFIEGHDINSDGIPDVTRIFTDSDHDGLDDIYDTVNGWNDPYSDENATGSNSPLQDFDLDGTRDWRDVNDEDDEYLTKDEDTNQDGDYSNDDLDLDGYPEYLDKTLDCELFIPEGFSPNGDGVHDFFQILCIQKYPNARLMIFNRDGNKLFDKEHYGNLDVWGTNENAWWWGISEHRWTIGRQGGLPAGNYVYVLQLGNGEVRNGTVMISY